MAPLVSVVVLARSEAQHIADCLESLLHQDFGRDKYEVVVVDGGSTDSTVELVGRYPVRLIHSLQGNLAKDRNLAVQAAQGNYVAFTDADCVAEKSWLSQLVAEMERSPREVVAVGGPNLVFDSDPAFSRVVGYAQETFLGSGGSPQAYRLRVCELLSSQV